MYYASGIHLSKNTISVITLDNKKNIIESGEFSTLDKVVSQLKSKKHRLSIALGADLFGIKIISSKKKLTPRECHQVIKRTIITETHYYHYALNYQKENYKIIVFYAEKQLIDKVDKTFSKREFRLIRVQPEINALLSLLPETKKEQIMLRPQGKEAILYYVRQGMLESCETIRSPSELKINPEICLWFIKNTFGISKLFLRSMQNEATIALGDNLFIANAIAL